MFLVTIYILLFCGFNSVKMNNIHVLFHVKTVGTAIAVNFVAAVVGAEAVEHAVILPLAVDFSDKLRIEIDILFKSGKGFGSFGAVLVHGAVIVAVIDNDEIKSVLVNKRKSLFVDLFGSIIYKVFHVAVEENHGNTVVCS